MAASPVPPNPAVSDSDVHLLLKRLSSLEQSVRQLLTDKKRVASEQHLLSLEHQLEASSSPRVIRSPSVSAPPSVLYPVTVGHNPSHVPCVFQMPLQYPRYKRSDYESMPEWQLDRLLQEYGLPIPASIPEKRELAIANFLWN